jgi:hypothetical protein
MIFIQIIFKANKKLVLSYKYIFQNKFILIFITYSTFFQVAKLRKPGENSGLGIALEGTVEVEDGREVRPHHYIRDIQIGGPVGLNGMLQRGDELLEVSIKCSISLHLRSNKYIYR